MKEIFLTAILSIAKIALKFIYFFIKLFTKTENKVTMLSRQSNNINIDFKLINEELENCIKSDNNKESLQIKILCKKIPDNFLGKISYCFYMLKCLYHIATSKVCIVDGYDISICVLKHKKGLKIVQIWHAMGAIKKFGYQVLDKGEGSNRKSSKNNENARELRFNNLHK